MGLERFGRLLIEISELSRDERSIVFIQLAKDFGFLVPSVERVKSKADQDGKPVATEHATMSRTPYSHTNNAAFADAAIRWSDYSPAQREATVKALATRFGRTEKAIRYQITSRLK